MTNAIPEGSAGSAKVVVAVAAALVALFFAASLAAKPAGAQETIVEDRNYTLNESTSVYGTSLPVRKGDRIVFTASGTMWPAGKANPFYPSTGPAGYDEIADCGNPNSNWPAPCARKFSLLAQIDTINRSDGWLYIGSSRQLVYGKDEQGSVYLSHNDDVPNNGEGAFQVNIKIYRDITPPNTTITSAPSSVTNSRQAGFNFSSTEANSTFECKLDGGAYEACNSPKTYSDLPDGPHTFSVRARDTAGNVDPTPGSHTWSVDASAPETTITSGPSGTLNSTAATFEFSSSEPGAAFECRLDGGVFEPCSSPKGYATLANGPHTFSVRARDAAGNIDATPASRAWSVDTAAPTVTSFSPAPDGVSGVARGTTVRATFSEKVRGASLSTNTVRLVKSGTTTLIPASIAYNATTRTVTLTPSVRLDATTTYVVRVTTGVKDLAGNRLDQDPGIAGLQMKVWRFRTA